MQSDEDRLVIHGVDTNPSTEEALTIPTMNYSPDQARGDDGTWSDTGGGGAEKGRAEKEDPIFDQWRSQASKSTLPRLKRALESANKFGSLKPSETEIKHKQIIEEEIAKREKGKNPH